MNSFFFFRLLSAFCRLLWHKTILKWKKKKKIRLLYQSIRNDLSLGLWKRFSFLITGPDILYSNLITTIKVSKVLALVVHPTHHHYTPWILFFSIRFSTLCEMNFSSFFLGRENLLNCRTPGQSVPTTLTQPLPPP